jgi:hypothetical protein
MKDYTEKHLICKKRNFSIEFKEGERSKYLETTSSAQFRAGPDLDLRNAALCPFGLACYPGGTNTGVRT